MANIGCQILFGTTIGRTSERVVEANRQIFLEHPVAVMVVALAVVVEARVDEELRGDVLVELEGECVFPFILHTLVAGEAIHARLPRDVLGHLPREIDDELRTEVGERMVVGLYTMSGGEPLCVLAVHEDGAVHVAIVHSQRRDFLRSLPCSWI